MELISIIVPVFNVEQYLNQCIESLVNQTYKHLEIILVDDGSTDKSPQICDAWKEKDNRIQVVHIPNEGAGNARNKGVELATGEWVVFVDSDDYIEYYMLECLHNCCDTEVDLVECCIVKTDGDEADFSLQNEGNSEVIKCSTEEALFYHIQDEMFQQTPPNKLYRKNIVQNVPFPIGKLIDDEFWTYKVIGNARRLVHIDKKLYAYRQHESSVMHETYSIKRMQALEAKRERANYINEKYPDLKGISEKNYWLSCLFQGQMILKCLRGKEKVEAIKLLQYYWKENRLTIQEIRTLSLDYKIWALCSKVSIYMTCMLRNLLKKGI